MEFNKKPDVTKNMHLKKRKHLRKLEELDTISLTASCCDICHCDCCKSHSIVCDWEGLYKKSPRIKRRRNSASNLPSNDKRLLTSVSKSKRPEANGNTDVKRSNSVIDLSQRSKKHFRHECDILDNLLSELKSTRPFPNNDSRFNSKSNEEEDGYTKLDTAEICKSLALLCLEPSIQRAYEKVPAKDQRIINRMAAKQCERMSLKENAWLARKIWENERIENNLLKCKQLKEYKDAMSEKQFEDYIVRRSRLQRIAQRDNKKLQQLRNSLLVKDQRSNERLAALRIERSLNLCQRRCDELRKSEVVNMNQEELLFDTLSRRQSDYQRLIERLKRADHVRAYLLSAQSRRIRNDNRVEQLMHEEHWRETQNFETRRREQLCDYIRQKSTRTQKFIEGQQRRNMALSQQAKISASLRQLVKNSIVLDEGTTVPNLGSIDKKCY